MIIDFLKEIIENKQLTFYDNKKKEIKVNTNFKVQKALKK